VFGHASKSKVAHQKYQKVECFEKPWGYTKYLTTHKNTNSQIKLVGMTMFDLLAKSQPNYNADAVRRAMRLAKEPPNVGSSSLGSTRQPLSKVASKVTNQPTSKPTSRPTSQPTSKPTSKPTSQPTSKPASKPTSKPTSKTSASQEDAQGERQFETGSQQEVNNIVESNKVVVFAKTYCPFCKKAKTLLESLNVKFVTIELDELGELGKTVQESLKEMTGQSTVPSVFANQEHLGGSDDLAKLVESDPEYFERL
jgi:glutaredoxin